MFTVRLVQSDRQFVAEVDEILLEAAERAGIILTYSCRSGTCRSCMTRVLAGLVEHDPEYTDELNIDVSELEDGYRLLCSAFARTDVELDK